MRKRRRLANKMTIMVCAVLLAVSAFFYAPMEVSADVGDSGSISSSVNADVYTLSGGYLGQGIKAINLYADALDNVLYAVDINVTAVLDTSIPLRIFGFNLNFNGKSIIYGLFGDGLDGESYLNRHIYSRELTLYLKGSELKSIWVDSGYSYYAQNTGSFVSNIMFDYYVDSINPLSDADVNEYESGYNAGYSAGESAGYVNGYSQGFTDGEASVDTDAIYDEAFQAGKDSVDTQSYYDAGYQAGYQVAYSEGYESGYDVGYQSAMDRIANWGADTADYPVTVYENSFSNLKVLCDINTNIPQISYGNFYFPQFNFAVNPNHTYKVVFNSSTYTKASAHASGSQSDNIVYNLGSLELPWYIGESYAFIPGSQFTSNVRLDCYIYGAVYDDGSNSSNFESWSAQYVLTFKSIDIKVYDMGPSGDTQNHIANQTDQLTNGYDDSKGNQVNSDLSTGLNDYETAENSLFATATTGMRDFTFFDFESVPAMITGISFIGSIMGSWFNQAGGASGVGIVLSILFSVILVAMVLGLYRWYQSRGGKN